MVIKSNTKHNSIKTSIPISIEEQKKNTEISNDMWMEFVRVSVPYPVIIEAFVFVEFSSVAHRLRFVRDRVQTDHIRSILFYHLIVLNRHRLAHGTIGGSKFHFIAAPSPSSFVVDVRSTLKHIDFCYSYKLKMAHGMQHRMMITFKRIWLSGKYDNHKSLRFSNTWGIGEHMARMCAARVSTCRHSMATTFGRDWVGKRRRSQEQRIVVECCAHNWREPKRLTKIT